VALVVACFVCLFYCVVWVLFARRLALTVSCPSVSVCLSLSVCLPACLSVCLFVCLFRNDFRTKFWCRARPGDPLKTFFVPRGTGDDDDGAGFAADQAGPRESHNAPAFATGSNRSFSSAPRPGGSFCCSHMLLAFPFSFPRTLCRRCCIVVFLNALLVLRVTGPGGDWVAGTGALGPGGKGARPPPDTFTCNICKKKGHWIQQCPERLEKGRLPVRPMSVPMVKEEGLGAGVSNEPVSTHHVLLLLLLLAAGCFGLLLTVLSFWCCA
jgi:hypothetical protein